MEHDFKKDNTASTFAKGYKALLLDLSFFMEEPLDKANCISNKVEIEAEKISEILGNLSPKNADYLLDKELKTIFAEKYQNYVSEFKQHLLKQVNRKKYLSMNKKKGGSFDFKKVLAVSFLIIIVASIICAFCFVALKKEEPIYYAEEDSKENTQSKKDSIFDQTGQIVALTFDEPLNGAEVVFNNTFLSEIKKFLKNEVESSFRQNLTDLLKNFKIKHSLTFNSQIKGSYITKNNKKYIYAIYEATAQVKLPSLKRTDSSALTSVFIISVKNNNLVTTQCSVNESDKNIVLKDPCKSEVLAKQGITFNNKEIVRLNK